MGDTTLPTPPPVRQTSRAVQKAETRQRIIDTAVAMFAERGYEDVAAAEIAAAAGVAHGLLFHYFGSKRGIYLEAMRGAAEQLDRAFVFDPMSPPAQQLRDGLTSHLRYLVTHQGLALRLVLGGRGADPQAWEVFEAARWRAVEATTVLFGVDPQNAAARMAGRALVSAIDEATVYWLQNGEPFEISELVEWMVRMAFHTLREAVALDPNLAIDPALAKMLRLPEGG
ncbi:TetR/AcrR family transcriptional regulator [Mycobacterium sp. BMJ-28]